MIWRNKCIENDNIADDLHSNSGYTILDSNGPPPAASITVEKSVEFSYEELAQATHNFSMANKIGEGGFGAVYYAELRGEVCNLMCY